MEYITAKVVAERLKVKEQTVWDWLRKGKLNGTKFDKFWRITEEDYQNYLKQGKRSTKKVI